MRNLASKWPMDGKKCLVDESKDGEAPDNQVVVTASTLSQMLTTFLPIRKLADLNVLDQPGP